ncbi:LysR family transcriptional regulator ArgP [Pseudooceanicola sediminis]|uniref:LysR family transcriptional regulator ArgP n=1 Tax=Pseudooceanicola sediminis TaxID=2211117 RepID=A0A399IXQ6_9RHOB|nr:LysR family transcriptional regulator ArgP [Pseudooceanicola sediminis]KAA2311580.1 LysR family transcriptional regulator ArgP [Puniceibacterium sp. HSS470]RII37049.1 LysR family transcriptional regulator ArgP [Pseudooceanicola sediminis]|tara:strand:+ start:39991 stop:40887 length:897 start_codon:yes stop_codon:yes gene_type:complete
MIDYAAARAVMAIVRTGSFERAAATLNVTPSAISQRVKTFEERIGTVLIERGVPCVATDKGLWLCRHMERVGMLEKDLLEHLPELSAPGEAMPRVTINVATNADSLGTWFLDAIASFAKSSDYLMNVSIDDEEHTADWLRRGRVLAAVTSLERPVQGCRVTPLGALWYKATASPEFVARHFPDGVTAGSFQLAPALTFNQKDRLQHAWARQVFGRDLAFPTHWLPSTQSFLQGSIAGMGWALNPAKLAEEHIARGDLVELVPGLGFERALFWQINRLAADQLTELTRSILAVARRELA